MRSSSFTIDYSAIEELQTALQNYQGNAEAAINDVLHNFAGYRIQEEIYRLMPVSKKKKGSHAKFAESLRNKNEHLSVTVSTTKSRHYLYFPDDGSSTRRHVGNQQFFLRGGEAAFDDVKNRCIARLINDF